MRYCREVPDAGHTLLADAHDGDDVPRGGERLAGGPRAQAPGAQAHRLVDVPLSRETRGLGTSHGAA